MTFYVEPGKEPGMYAVSKRGVFNRRVRFGSCDGYLAALRLAVELAAPGDLISTPEGWMQRQATWRATYDQ